MLNERTDVLIVGASPTGMALSIALLQAGVEHEIVDRLEEGQNTSRAGVIHAQTLESLSGLGVTDRLLELGIKRDLFAIRDRDRPLLSLRFNDLPTDFPYLLMIPQNLTEQVFEARIGELGGRVQRGWEATRIEEAPEGTTVTLSGKGGERTVTARYVVGGDGMHSIVRRTSGIEFDGDAYPESFVLADVRLDWALGDKEVSLFFSPEGLLVVAPLPDGSVRIVATMENAPETPSLAVIQELVGRRGPKGGRSRVSDLTWSSRFRLHHRVARTYRNGNLFLMGDAAHVHSPAGGQGMNTGLVDAVVLGELLADVIAGRRSEKELDLYQELRRPAAEQVLQLAGFMTKLALAKGTVRRFLRNMVLSVVNVNPSARRRIKMNLSGLSRATLAQLPPAKVNATSAPVERKPDLKLAA
jgi:2-polyprenyl-6-methoxyphenol hydroxylase-like FAD-dependent oxidoreductase